MTKQTIDNAILETAQNVHNVIRITVMYITVISVGTVTMLLNIIKFMRFIRNTTISNSNIMTPDIGHC